MKIPTPYELRARRVSMVGCENCGHYPQEHSYIGNGCRKPGCRCTINATEVAKHRMAAFRTFRLELERAKNG